MKVLSTLVAAVLLLGDASAIRIDNKSGSHTRLDITQGARIQATIAKDAQMIGQIKIKADNATK